MKMYCSVALALKEIFTSHVKPCIITEEPGWYLVEVVQDCGATVLNCLASSFSYFPYLLLVHIECYCFVRFLLPNVCSSSAWECLNHSY